ncbi:MAG: tRNA lysidine(34) synthetase TilS [Candidatus Aminicenantes bacterium]|nr:tRNA lysidine(34) synthetase TilS [Candidatus Aminicenantes bacterium]
MTGDIYAKLKRTVARHKMIVPGDTVLVAFSGGADSTALLHLLLELRREVAFGLALAHFNHRLRAAADADERFVRDVARSLRLRIIAGRRDVKAFARRRGLNVEEAARILRYEFLGRAAARTGATKIATGHTLNDQAETFLMRLLRGSGPRGLAGIYPVHEGKIVRPLIEISRKEVEAFCRRKRLTFRTDETNLDKRYLRNKIRRQLVPYLERHYEPGLMVKFGRLASIFQEDESVLEDMIRAKTDRLIVRCDRGLTLDARRLARLPRGLARRAVRAFIEETAGDLRRISFQDVEAVLELGEGKELTLPKKLHLQREAGLIQVRAESPPPARYAIFWDGRGALPVPGAALTFSGQFKKRAAARLPFDDRTRCFCDAKKLRFPLLVRARKEGDLYRPLGAPGKKKLKEILRAKKIPLRDRNFLPIFCSGGKIVWVPGLPVAEDFKVTPETKTIFCIHKK